MGRDGNRNAPFEAYDAQAEAEIVPKDAAFRSAHRMRGELRRMVDACGHGRVGECRIIQVLADHPAPP